MNWLAHLHVAHRVRPAELEPGDATLWILGNLAGDFARADELDALPTPMIAGIRAHRRLDAFTDAHDVVAGSRRRVPPALRRYAGVLVDVFFDHVLADQWTEWHEVPLRTFVDSVHADLRRHADRLPARLRAAAPHIAQHDWLASYATIDGIRDVLRRMAGRLSRPAPLAVGADVLADQLEGFAADFAAFYPDALIEARAWTSSVGEVAPPGP